MRSVHVVVHRQYVALEFAEDLREDRRRETEGIVDEQLVLPVTDELGIDRRDEPIDVHPYRSFREIEASDMFVVHTPDVLAEEIAFDRLRSRQRNVAAITAEQDDVGLVRVARRAAHVETCHVLAGEQFLSRLRNRRRLEIVDVHSDAHESGRDGTLHDTGDLVFVTARQHDGMRPYGRSDGRSELGSEFRIHVDVRDSGYPCVGEQIARPSLFLYEAAREHGMGFHGLPWPELHVREELGMIADHAFLRDEDVVEDDGMGADDDVVADDGIREIGEVADLHVAPQYGVAQTRSGADDAIVADDAVRQTGAVADDDVIAQGDESGEMGRRGEFEVVATDARIAALAGNVHMNAPGQHVGVGELIFVEIADVLPVTIGDVAIERESLLQHQGIEVLAEVEFRLGGNQVQYRRFQDVDTGIDGIAEHLTP